MDVYIFQAALWCADCAGNLRVQLIDSEDSDISPQGPYADGGGEADGPQCCDGCGEFLENPLTGDGYRYLLELLAPYIPPNYSQILEESGAYEVARMVRDRVLDDARAVKESPDLFERDPTRRKHRLDSLATMAQWADYYPEAFENLEESTL